MRQDGNISLEELLNLIKCESKRDIVDEPKTALRMTDADFEKEMAAGMEAIEKDVSKMMNAKQHYRINKEILKSMAKEVWEKVKKADEKVLTEDELHRHLVLCAKGSAQAQWSRSGFTSWEETLKSMNEEMIREKCTEAFEILDCKREGRVCFDDAFEGLLKSWYYTRRKTAYMDKDDFLTIAKIANKFEGCVVTSGQDRYNLYLAVGKDVFDAMDTNKSGFVEGKPYCLYSMLQVTRWHTRLTLVHTNTPIRIRG